MSGGTRSGRPGRQSVSIGDVARAVGVSAQTVSRVANGRDNVNAATRERVLGAMRRLGYRPNSAARALRQGRFQTIGVILFRLTATGKSATVEAITTQAAAEGYAITLIPIEVPSQDHMLGAFTRMNELAVDAVIVFIETHLLDAAVVELPPGVHVVVVDSDADDRYRVIDSDQAGGTAAAVDHLLGLGHATIWHVTGPETSFAARRRSRAWRAALEASGRPVPPPVAGDWTAAGGYAAGQALADRPDCTAVFAANDQTALGLLRAFAEHGLAVPDRVSVVGFDDLPESAYFTPPLTTVRQDFPEVGRRSVREVLRQIRDGAAPPPGTEVIPTRLMIRESTAPPPGQAPM
ncbi:LacI family DNA-binding transcriptional regulator [Glycomyces xiaoerkulensis]|uniref:LacI family DNA-binding transcriptional regulator n=1 Tax=Glycomyces xiaoerkulensis TaxID=2038139 RepID=UPI0038CBFBB6